jgi:hypothetical protein
LSADATSLTEYGRQWVELWGWGPAIWLPKSSSTNHQRWIYQEQKKNLDVNISKFLKEFKNWFYRLKYRVFGTGGRLVKF